MAANKSKTARPAQVIKRDGSVVPFDESKIADAVYAAARAVGGRNFRLAQKLAAAVTDALGATFDGERINIEDIQDTVEKVLIEAGHARTAKEYILYRQKRTELRRQILVREGGTAAPVVEVDMRSADKLAPWDKGRISSALIREFQVPPGVACDVASSVEAKIFQSGITRISTGLIRELVDNELFERGMAGLLHHRGQIALPSFTMDQFFKTGIEQREPTPDDLNAAVSRDVMRQYALQAVFSPEITALHGRGDLHLHHLGGINRFIRRRHCGPVACTGAADALPALARHLAGLQPYFVAAPRLDLFNVLFAPMAAELGPAGTRAAVDRFLELMHQSHLAGRSRGRTAIDLYGAVPADVGGLGTADLFPVLGTAAPGTYNDCYRAGNMLAGTVLDALAAPGLADAFDVRLHCSETCGADPVETALMERLYGLAAAGGRVQFRFPADHRGGDRRMGFLGGGDTAFHEVSVNVGRIFFQIPVTGTEEAIESFKNIFAAALASGIEKLDFLSSLMRRPGQILWKLGRKAPGGALFDVRNAHMTVRLSGIREALLACWEADLNGEDVLFELVSIAADIIDGKGDEHPFDVRLRPGRADRAAARFAEADIERYPEKRDLLTADREGRLRYEGMPVLHGDDPVPIGASVREMVTYPALPFEAGTLAVTMGTQVDRFGKFMAIVEDVRDLGVFDAVILERSQPN
ncbi:MAG: ATP cone domain-containing protein [Planctomycetota bacterium]